MSAYSVEVKGGAAGPFTVRSANYEFLVDTHGGGITPPDTLLASLGSCIGVYLVKYAQGAKLHLEKFSVKVDADFTKEPPHYFREIRASIDLGGLILDERRKKAMLDFIRNCPVHATLKADPSVLIELRP